MTSASSAPAPHSSDGNAATRQANGPNSAGRSGHGPRTALDLFANLLGLASTEGDQPLMAQSTAAEALDATALQRKPHKGPRQAKNDVLAADATDPSALPGGVNPLADLIGWRPAPLVTAPTHGANASPDPGKSDPAMMSETEIQTGIELKSMSMLTEPQAADPKLLAAIASGFGADAKILGQTSSAVSTLTSSSPSTTLTAMASAPSLDSEQAASGSVASQATTPPTTTSQNGSTRAGGAAPWRSTATLGGARAQPASAPVMPSNTTTLQSAQNALVINGRETGAVLPPLRSTVTLDQRFSVVGTDEVAAGTLGLPMVTVRAQEQRGDSPASQHGEHAIGAFNVNDIQDPDGPDAAFSLEAALSPEEELDPNSFLNPDQLRHASVRVGEGTDEAIDIRLSLAGDEVNVSFLSNSAEMRAGLQQHANGTLSDLMQRSGLNLSEVSVGAHSQQGSGASGQSGQPSNPSDGRGGSDRGGHQATALSDQAAMRPSMQRPQNVRRADGGPALDVFA